ncbi:MAG: hypothetical protein WAK21_19090, partial [Candidatus Sulfotelmatobacter sp.]
AQSRLSTFLFGNMRKVYDQQGNFEFRQNNLPGLAIHRLENSAQTLVALHHNVKGPSQRVYVQRTNYAEGAGKVVGRRSRFKLV